MCRGISGGYKPAEAKVGIVALQSIVPVTALSPICLYEPESTQRRAPTTQRRAATKHTARHQKQGRVRYLRQVTVDREADAAESALGVQLTDPRGVHRVTRMSVWGRVSVVVRIGRNGQGLPVSPCSCNNSCQG